METGLLQWSLLVACAVFVSSSQALQVRSCSRNPSSDIITVNWAHVVPDPVQVPGDITLSVSVTVKQPISGDLTADVTISRKLGPMWLDLPCVKTSVGNLGSCTYHNFCDVLASTNRTGLCPRLLTSNNIKCECPIQPGTYTIPQSAMKLDPKFLQLPSAVMAGEYQASLRVIDRSTMQEIVCYDIDVTIANPPSKKRFGSLGRFLVNLFG